LGVGPCPLWRLPFANKFRTNLFNLIIRFKCVCPHHCTKVFSTFGISKKFSCSYFAAGNFLSKFSEKLDLLILICLFEKMGGEHGSRTLVLPFPSLSISLTPPFEFSSTPPADD